MAASEPNVERRLLWTPEQGSRCVLLLLVRRVARRACSALRLYPSLIQDADPRRGAARRRARAERVPRAVPGAIWGAREGTGGARRYVRDAVMWSRVLTPRAADPYHTYLSLAAAACFARSPEGAGWDLPVLDPLVNATEETTRWAHAHIPEKGD